MNPTLDDCVHLMEMLCDQPFPNVATGKLGVSSSLSGAGCHE